MIYSRVRNIFLLLLGMFFCISVMGSSVYSQDIAIIASDSLTYTKRAIRGATKAISQTYTKAKFHQFYLSGHPNNDLPIVDSIRNINSKLIITIGTQATEFAKINCSDKSIVFAAVKYPALSGFVTQDGRPTKNITGASLDMPTDIQFRYFKQLVPGLKTMGVLYTESTQPLIPPSQKIASQMGLKLIPIKITHERDLPMALDSLARTVDGIWSVADARLFSPRSTQFILLNCLKHGVPFMGFSRNVVESGALFAIDFDYKAIGRQAGEIAKRILSGARVEDCPVSAPDIRWFHYNERTADYLRIKVPEELSAIAKEVYR